MNRTSATFSIIYPLLYATINCRTLAFVFFLHIQHTHTRTHAHTHTRTYAHTPGRPDAPTPERPDARTPGRADARTRGRARTYGVQARGLNDYTTDLAPVLKHIPYASVQERCNDLFFEQQTYIYHKHRLQDIGTHHTL